MTLDEIISSDKHFLTPADIAPLIRCDPNYIRVAAKNNPASLGFPVMRSGRNTKIPRMAFLKFLGVDL